jgi:peptidoglycan/LPS O-acetylase OafA/YrhL
MSGEGNIGLAVGGYADFAKTKTFGSLNGLRAIAILAVIWHHAPFAKHGWQIVSRGFLGVDLFFIISGFLIVTLLLREQKRTKTISLHNFYVRRILRIFPPYYLMLLVVGTVAFLNPGGASSKAVPHDLPYALLFLSNLVPMHSILSITWSLSVEEQFYIIVPTIEKYARRAMPLLLPIAYVLVCLPTFGAFSNLGLPSFFREVSFGPILLGVVLAHVLDDPRGFVWVSRVVGWKLAPLFALGLLFVALSNPAGDISGWPRLAMHWSMMALVASCVVREDNFLAPLMSLWPLRRIGAVSYGMYLYHHLVMYFVLKGLGAFDMTQGYIAFASTALASWAIAELSYRFFEVRFLALKVRFGSQSTAAATA